MDPANLPPISGHAILILLLQLAGLLALARALSEVMRRVGQPAVIGELLAGIVLGPTILGHYLPAVFVTVFPPLARQFHLLEVISWLGMVLLLLLTGLETDLRVMRRLGRSSLFASLGGMLANFTLGVTLGMLLPDRYLTDPANRPIFAAFLATALAITAMPVVAKILIDLKLIKRNLGVVILSAGVVDDTTGWLVLSVIAGIASAGVFSASKLALTLAALVVYVAVMRYVVYPVFSRLLSFVNAHVQLAGADITLILVFTFLSAAATEAIGVHAVFGAFVMGLLVRQVPRVRESSLHALEVFVLAALSPIFFAFVGLKVDLWALTGWQLPLIVIGTAVLGKLVGCYAGARLGGIAHWESLAIGFGMNARGAMELIVALIGLSLGLLTQEMYSTIVLVAVVTSFMAPILLRAVISKLAMTEEERRRIEDDGRQRLIPTGPLRVLVPTAGGGNANGALTLAAPLVRASAGTLTALFVESPVTTRFRDRLIGRSASLAGRGLDAQLAHAAERLGGQRRALVVKRVRSSEPAAAVLGEAGRDYDILMLGAAPHHLVERSMIGDVLAGTKLPTVIVRAVGGALPERFERIVVPVDGSVFARQAAEFAFAYAGATGSATVTLLHVVDETRVLTGSLTVSDQRAAHVLDEQEETSAEVRIRETFGSMAAAYETDWDVRVLGSGDPSATIIEESRSDRCDLLVLGAENKMLSQPLFFGQGTAAIVERAGCTTAVVVPAIG